MAEEVLSTPLNVVVWGYDPKTGDPVFGQTSTLSPRLFLTNGRLCAGGSTTGDVREMLALKDDDVVLISARLMGSETHGVGYWLTYPAYAQAQVNVTLWEAEADKGELSHVRFKTLEEIRALAVGPPRAHEHRDLAADYLYVISHHQVTVHNS